MKPIINCHAHVFTGDMVPKFLAKKFLMWPLYYLLPLTPVVALFRWWYREPGAWPLKPWYKSIKRNVYNVTMFLRRIFVLLLIRRAIESFVGLQVFFIGYDFLKKQTSSEGSKRVEAVRRFLEERTDMPWPVPDTTLQVLFVCITILFIPWARKLIFLGLGSIFKVVGKKIVKKETLELARRYLNIGRYAFNTQQSDIFSKLRGQYQQGTGFILLPMDMEYMEAGKLPPKYRYREQMKQLADIKENHPATAFPFVFVDPRRIGTGTDEKNYQAGDKPFFSYRIAKENKVELEDCFIREYIEGKAFSGFKIYPALGYYPFDHKLLPLWKYAADNCVPILTHCIRGTIFYRGKKDVSWDYHPVFKESFGGEDYRALLLPEKRNIDFSVNFTHPMNYLCLLEETFLRQVVAAANETDKSIGELFGYVNEDTPLAYNLSHLKICFGHFGGDDEWTRYFEQDRYGHSNQFTKNPHRGIDFLRGDDGASPGKPEQLWKFTDWYSIICSMMLQYPNVYADVSYILHDNERLIPLLKETLRNDGLKEKVLFGTDFYVVRNHKSDKNICADIRGGLSDAEFDLIAKHNPIKFLQRCPAQHTEEQSEHSTIASVPM